jgi:hypothetical protein
MQYLPSIHPEAITQHRLACQRQSCSGIEQQTMHRSSHMSAAAAAVALQVMKAFAEAEAHKGVSLVVAYAPCVMQGISEGMSCSVNEARTAVEVGYWPLYRCAAIIIHHPCCYVFIFIILVVCFTAGCLIRVCDLHRVSVEQHALFEGCLCMQQCVCAS